jgi:hypothetical protein
MRPPTSPPDRFSQRARQSGPQAAASPVPLLVGGLSLALSVALLVWTMLTSSLIPVFGETRFLAAAADTWPLSVAGYLLAPIVVVLALGWDRVLQRRGLQDRNFALKPRYGLYLRILTGAGFIISLWHIFNIAVAVASNGATVS